MTDPSHDCPLCAEARARWERIKAEVAAGEPGPPWDEVAEEQIAYAASTYDEETGRSRPLLRKRTR